MIMENRNGRIAVSFDAIHVWPFTIVGFISIVFASVGRLMTVFERLWELVNNETTSVIHEKIPDFKYKVLNGKFFQNGNRLHTVASIALLLACLSVCPKMAIDYTRSHRLHFCQSTFSIIRGISNGITNIWLSHLCHSNVFSAIFLVFSKICGGCRPPRSDVVGMSQCDFLAEGPKICPEPNFLLVLMVTLPDVHASVLGAIF